MEKRGERFFLGEQVGANRVDDFFGRLGGRGTGTFLQGLDFGPGLVGGFGGEVGRKEGEGEEGGREFHREGAGLGSCRETTRGRWSLASRQRVSR